MRIFLLYFWVLTAGLLALPAYAQPLRIVVSFSILTDLTLAVAGYDTPLTTLVGPDSDAHTYEPTPADVKAIANADVLIVNGLGFEGWLDRLRQSSGFKGRLVVASEGINPLLRELTPDPHAWQSVVNAQRYVANIAEGLKAADPVHASLYARNANVYTARLKTFEGWVKKRISAIPPAKRKAITSHDALGYFGTHYGVTFIAPLGLTTSGDISAGGLARLIDQIRERHIRAVFFENMSDPRLMQQLVADAGAVIGGTLYTDALSKPDGPACDYIAMFRYNVQTLAKAMLAN